MKALEQQWESILIGGVSALIALCLSGKASEFQESAMLDQTDKLILFVAYKEIQKSPAQRVAGSTVWEKAFAVQPNLAPVTVPARLKRLVSRGLLQKDDDNSSNRTKLYAPSTDGLQVFGEMADSFSN